MGAVWYPVTIDRIRRAETWIAFFVKLLPGKFQRCGLYDNKVIAFRDINPLAPVHLLIIPREHITTLNDISEQETMLMGHMLQLPANWQSNMGLRRRVTG